MARALHKPKGITLNANVPYEQVKVVFSWSFSGNDNLIDPSIQKDTINACAKETTKVILEQLSGDFFGIFVDEFADISDKEQMTLCLRYINKKGEVTERFLSFVHVSNTTSLTLKNEIESLLMKHL